MNNGMPVYTLADVVAELGGSATLWERAVELCASGNADGAARIERELRELELRAPAERRCS